jgi:hypothetical protein
VSHVAAAPKSGKIPFAEASTYIGESHQVAATLISDLWFVPMLFN